MEERHSEILAYVIGIAIGDGNLSNANGRAVRLRITCDNKYPKLIREILFAVSQIMPDNKTSIVERANQNCVDVSCHSNQWEKLLGWKAKGGPKHIQKVRIPDWIKNSDSYAASCLRGLFQTDGCIYIDRGYKMVNFVTINPGLSEDVFEMIAKIGFKPRVYTVKKNEKIRNDKFTIRVSRDVEKFIKKVSLVKE